MWKQKIQSAWLIDCCLGVCEPRSLSFLTSFARSDDVLNFDWSITLTPTRRLCTFGCDAFHLESEYVIVGSGRRTDVPYYSIPWHCKTEERFVLLGDTVHVYMAAWIFDLSSHHRSAFLPERNSSPRTKPNPFQVFVLPFI